MRLLLFNLGASPHHAPIPTLRELDAVAATTLCAGHQWGGGLRLFIGNYCSREALLALLHTQHGEDDSHLSEASQRDHLEMRAALTGSCAEGGRAYGPLCH